MNNSTSNSFTSSTQSQDNTMTTLYIDNGVSINLTQYLSDPIGHIERIPPMFVSKTVGEKLAIAEFTKNTAIVHAISQWLTANLKGARYLNAMRSYNETWDGLLRANPNGWAK
jgi:hypothetical protein